MKLRTLLTTGKRKAMLNAQVIAQAEAAHNQAILADLNAFTHIEANAHRWDVSSWVCSADGIRKRMRTRRSSTLAMGEHTLWHNHHGSLNPHMMSQLPSLNDSARTLDVVGLRELTHNLNACFSMPTPIAWSLVPGGSNNRRRTSNLSASCLAMHPRTHTTAQHLPTWQILAHFLPTSMHLVLHQQTPGGNRFPQIGKYHLTSQDIGSLASKNIMLLFRDRRPHLRVRRRHAHRPRRSFLQRRRL